MKIIGVEQNGLSHQACLPTLFIKPDTAIHHIEQPFYLPDFSQDIRCKVGIVVKICKQGKCISEKFAHKYYEEITLGIDFTAYDILEQLQQKQQTWELAKSFDNSLIIGRFGSKDMFSDESICLLKNHQKIQERNMQDMLNLIGKHISYISHFFTLRKGDCIFMETTQTADKIRINDQLQVFCGDDKLFAVEIL